MNLRRALFVIVESEATNSRDEWGTSMQRRLDRLRVLAMLGATACLVVGYQLTAHEAQLRSLQRHLPARFSRS